MITSARSSGRTTMLLKHLLQEGRFSNGVFIVRYANDIDYVHKLAIKLVQEMPELELSRTQYRYVWYRRRGNSQDVRLWIATMGEVINQSGHRVEVIDFLMDHLP